MAARGKKPAKARKPKRASKPAKVDTLKSPGDGDWKPVFLKVLASSGNVRMACKKAGVSRQAAYKQREQEKEFEAAWKEALDDACDLLVEAAMKRAKKSSDTLLIFLLKSHRPEVYRAKPPEPELPKGGPVFNGPVQIKLDGMSSDDLRRLLELRARLVAGPASGNGDPDPPGRAEPA